jgi:ABC-type glycerol-3-phosphate transport system substrate-binding protein
MSRAFALLGVVAVLLAACGKYGPPVRSRPAPKAATSAAATPDADATHDEERERSQ